MHTEVGVCCSTCDHFQPKVGGYAGWCADRCIKVKRYYTCGQHTWAQEFLVEKQAMESAIPTTTTGIPWGKAT